MPTLEGLSSRAITVFAGRWRLMSVFAGAPQSRCLPQLCGLPCSAWGEGLREAQFFLERPGFRTSLWCGARGPVGCYHETRCVRSVCGGRQLPERLECSGLVTLVQGLRRVASRVKWSGVYWRG